jgi:hypothetical protein
MIGYAADILRYFVMNKTTIAAITDKLVNAVSNTEIWIAAFRHDPRT